MGMMNKSSASAEIDNQVMSHPSIEILRDDIKNKLTVQIKAITDSTLLEVGKLSILTTLFT